MPMVHVGFASGAVAQPRMHPPQWLGLVLVLTHTPLHRVSPAAQPETQTPIWQTGVPPEHVLAQLPQWAAVESEASQPLFGLPSQSPKPGRHVYAHAELAHETVVLARAAHGMLQPPQCATVDRVSVSHPLAIAPSQLPKPGSQVIRHALAVHCVLELAKVPQALLHAPQCAIELVVSTQDDPHRV